MKTIKASSNPGNPFVVTVKNTNLEDLSKPFFLYAKDKNPFSVKQSLFLIYKTDKRFTDGKKYLHYDINMFRELKPKWVKQKEISYITYWLAPYDQRLPILNSKYPSILKDRTKVFFEKHSQQKARGSATGSI